MQGTTVVARGVSLATTGGLCNPILATAELGGSIFGAIGAIVAPFIALIIIAAVLSFLAFRVWRKRATVAA